MTASAHPGATHAPPQMTHRTDTPEPAQPAQTPGSETTAAARRPSIRDQMADNPFMSLLGGVLIVLLATNLSTSNFRISDTNNRIDDTNERIDDTNERITRLESRIDARFDKFEARFDKESDKVDARFESVDNELDEINRLLATILARLDERAGDAPRVAARAQGMPVVQVVGVLDPLAGWPGQRGVSWRLGDAGGVESPLG